MTTLIKLGGSLVTDKQKPKSFHRDAVQAIARQLADLRANDPERRLVLGHGSGSFGHFEAQQYDTMAGVRSSRDQLGFARVGAAASQLSQLILDELLAAALPAMRFQPSSMQISRERKLTHIELRPLSLALDMGLLPLVHGDITLDEAQGGTIISTEALFAALIAPLQVKTIILLGNVDGALDQAGRLIPRITPGSFAQHKNALGAADGYDVTGGMRQKVADMLALAQRHPQLRIHIANGNRGGILLDLLAGELDAGTTISAD